MDLRDMVRVVERLNDNAVLVSFKNNVARVYEHSEEGTKADDISANLSRSTEFVSASNLFDRGYPTLIHDGKSESYFSRETKKRLFSLAKQNYFYPQKLEVNIDATFQEIAEGLNIGKKKARDWKSIGSGLGIGVLTPVVTPFGLLVSMFVSGQHNGTGPNFAMLSLAPPIMGYNAIRELTQPQTEYLSLGDVDAITNEPTDERYPTVSFNGKPGKFHSLGLRFATGDVGSISPPYDPKHEGKEGVMAYLRLSNPVMRSYDQKRYAEETPYLALDKSLNAKMNSLLEERAAFPELQEKFVAGLNRENQEALLRNIGFM